MNRILGVLILFGATVLASLVTLKLIVAIIERGYGVVGITIDFGMTGDTKQLFHAMNRIVVVDKLST